MSKCIFCGHETGNTQFCQSCGAQVGGEMLPPQRPITDDTPVDETVQEVTPAEEEPEQKWESSPKQFYRPEGAPGLLAGNIITLCLALILCVNSLGVTFLAIILSIIGIVNASKVKTAGSEFEAQARKRTATGMLVFSCILIVIGFVVFLIVKLIAGIAHGLISLIF